MRSSALRAPEPGPEAPARRHDGERPVDLVHLSRQCFGDKRLETELLRLFVRQARQIQAGLEAEVGDDSVSCLPASELLHTLVGSARVVGAHRVAGLAERHEAALRARPEAVLGEADRAGMRAAVEEACTYIGGLLDA
ncbi:Hpt domain-containing protein [Lichenibacterium ramalinae]|uniref:Hpt domain-containing protein n=1 Tax=Lichenibacterium ramalinae TaxID=2316527 RepID=A0A4Q2RFW3_9HYPH|nr:Hpt domain-containing protein [Lichenibacterium ramalinae]RYB05275.1 Hpt domain-containing protein [Lichenibacterium ramalinae]